MSLGLTRADLQANAQAKLDDAILLLKQGRYSNAYYLAGYAVEIGLKACIAAQITAETIPAKEFIKGILNHEFTGLVGLAGLKWTSRSSRTKTQTLLLTGPLFQNGHQIRDMKRSIQHRPKHLLMLLLIRNPEFSNGSKHVGERRSRAP